MKSNLNFTVWLMRISLIVALIVALLSWLNGVQIFNIIVRAGVSFGIIFLLLIGTLRAFEKTASSEPAPDKDAAGRGGLVDISVGEDDLTSLVQSSDVPGQVDKDLSLGLPDSKKQADIIRRMGWGGE
ncbi:hypothetical protein ACPUYX_02105 [Desulfosporosinus sp. SYSU MS00001]|uniref:hypothetical protein n=1 Tax=Desulfosporosinus sp. SYSU MS00001 TaxID=3416284 RepID=UPI003CFB86A6